jgi:hypothetical protein
MVAIYPAALFTLCSLVQGVRQVQLEFKTSSFFDEEIWVLLTRHVTDTHRTSDFIALKVDTEDDLIPISGVVENQHTLSSKVCLPESPSLVCNLNHRREVTQTAHIF